MRRSSVVLFAGIFLFASALFAQEKPITSEGGAVFDAASQKAHGSTPDSKRELPGPGGEAVPDVLEGEEKVLTTVSQEEEEDLSFIILPGDVVEINVFGSNMHHPGVTLRVSREGAIYFPLLGEIKLAGLDAVEATKKLEAMLLDGYLTDPRVAVYIHERVASVMLRTFTISGSIGRAGIYNVEGNLKLIDAVNVAGGVTPDADTSQVRVIRKTEEEEETFIMDLYELGMDFSIRGRDRIKVESFGNYTIYGEIMRPGKYFISKELMTADAVLAAGGFTPTASKNGVKIIRESDEGKKKVIKVPVAHIFRTGKKSRDELLKDGDIVIVPESWF